MCEFRILSTINNRFGVEVVYLTKTLVMSVPFWEKAETHFLSVIGLYIATEKGVTTFREILAESYDLLQEHKSWDSLSQVLLSTANDNLRSILLEDALFDVAEGWEYQSQQRNNMALVGSFKRLELLIKSN